MEEINTHTNQTKGLRQALEGQIQELSTQVLALNERTSRNQIG